MKKRIISYLVCVFVLLTGSNWLAASSQPVSIENMFSRELLEKLSIPQFVWLENGKALLLDNRIELGKRNFELLDPKNGKRQVISDSGKIQALFKNYFPESPLTGLYWPDALDSQGKQAVYLLDNDLFLVDLVNNTVKRLTQTPGAEESPAFSPNGRWVSFIRDNEIYTLDAASGTEKQLTTGSSATLLNGKLSWVYWEELYDHSTVPYTWSPDSNAIAYLQSDESPVSISTFVHYKPATQAVVQQRYPKAGQPNPIVRLGIVEIASAKTTWVDCGQYEYLVRFNWLPDSSQIAVQTMNRPQSHLKLFFTDRATGSSTLVLEEHQPAWVNLNDTPYFLKNSKRFIWMSERDGYQHLYLYSMEKQGIKLIRQLTKGNYMVISSTGGLTSGNGGLMGVDEKRGLLYFTSNRDALQEYHLFQIKLDGQGLKKISSGPGIHAVQFSADMNYYLETYSNFSQPPELSLHKADGKKTSVVTPSAKEAVAPWELCGSEFHVVKAEDGLELPIMMQKPAAYDPAKTKTYPAVIYVYGGPGSQQVRDEWSTRRALWHNLLNREGYFTFVVEVRAGMPKNKATETADYKQAYGMQAVTDIMAAVRWIKQNPAIDPERLGLWGGSGGGCTTLYVMTHVADFKAGISLFPVTDWHYYDSVYTERYQSTPQDNPDGYKATSCVETAPNLKGKLLIAHGTYDDNVHPQNTYAFINQLIAKNIQFELMIYPWRKHGIADHAGRLHMYTLMLDFWKRHL